jgi:hypothetical protein
VPGSSGGRFASKVAAEEAREDAATSGDVIADEEAAGEGAAAEEPDEA